MLASVIVVVPVFRDAKSFSKHRNLTNHFTHHVAVCGTTAGNLLKREALPVKARSTVGCSFSLSIASSY